MTLVFRRALDPGTHVLIIGCGSYPNTDANPKAPYLLPLLSAGRSARALAQWFIEKRDEVSPPLASLRLLLAEPTNALDHTPVAATFDPKVFGADAAHDPRQGSLAVAAPTLKNICDASDDWMDDAAAAQNPIETLILLYAAGHGFQSDEQLFAPHDFGSTRRIWAETVSLDQTARGMAVCPPGKQIIIGDCCRSDIPPGKSTPTGAHGTPLLEASIEDVVANSANMLEVYACRPFHVATGDPNGVSTLMTSLLESLGGAWADDVDAQGVHWVTGRSMREYLRTKGHDPLERGQGELLTILPIHTPLSAPIIVRSAPGYALPACSTARITCQTATQTWNRPPGLSEDWQVDLPTQAQYSAEITFPPGGAYLQKALGKITVTRPVPKVLEVKVTP